MKILKQNLLIFFIFALLVVLTAVSYTLIIFNKEISMDSINTTVLILSIILFMILGLLVGAVKKRNGLRNGFIYGFIIALFLFLYSFLGNDEFSFHQLIRYLILLLSSSLGGVIGVNIPKKK
ncbi:TIGR04086 family membrane protein [Mycoplasmatota bacterium zrk1]